MSQCVIIYILKARKTDFSANYDIFINTTHVDNTPVSVIEAMALGLPVVSTNVGGIPYLLEDRKDALLIEKGVAKDMYKAVIFLIDNPEQAIKKTQNARIKVENFDWAVIKQEWMKLFI